MTEHRLLPIGARPLHPNETLIVATATARGLYVGVCTCGTIITGANDIDLYCHLKDHRRSAQILANGGGAA